MGPFRTAEWLDGFLQKHPKHVELSAPRQPCKRANMGNSYGWLTRFLSRWQRCCLFFIPMLGQVPTWPPNLSTPVAVETLETWHAQQDRKIQDWAVRSGLPKPRPNPGNLAVDADAVRSCHVLEGLDTLYVHYTYKFIVCIYMYVHIFIYMDF